MSSLQGSRFISSLAAKPSLAAVVEEDSSPRSDNGSRTSFNKDESVIFSTSQDSRKSFVEDTSLEKYRAKLESLLHIMRPLTTLQQNVQAARGKRMRCYLLQCYNSLISLWNRQERQWNDVVQLFRRVWLLNSVVLEGISVVAVFMTWKSWLQRPLQPSMKTSVWSVVLSFLCWLVLHWVLSHRTQFLLPWEKICLEWGKRYWKRSMRPQK
ncbi:hypothetical protein GAYE_PCTG10G0456 [Galdieria yellowstonensis]|uniref:Uncharacterized protein n=1 Tax=Galdieria yellowstonensis TaxID=3028027 RepID=A0AAV9I2Y7_9RHOD|nr:hypothetical protein GAYE_PCTG10G0456 [Galdieria yellowstonensis]